MPNILLDNIWNIFFRKNMYLNATEISIFSVYEWRKCNWCYLCLFCFIHKCTLLTAVKLFLCTTLHGPNMDIQDWNMDQDLCSWKCKCTVLCWVMCHFLWERFVYIPSPSFISSVISSGPLSCVYGMFRAQQRYMDLLCLWFGCRRCYERQAWLNFCFLI